MTETPGESMHSAVRRYVDGDGDAAIAADWATANEDTRAAWEEAATEYAQRRAAAEREAREARRA